MWCRNVQYPCRVQDKQGGGGGSMSCASRVRRIQTGGKGSVGRWRDECARSYRGGYKGVKRGEVEVAGEVWGGREAGWRLHDKG